MKKEKKLYGEGREKENGNVKTPFEKVGKEKRFMKISFYTKGKEKEKWVNKNYLERISKREKIGIILLLYRRRGEQNRVVHK